MPNGSAPSLEDQIEEARRALRSFDAHLSSALGDAFPSPSAASSPSSQRRHGPSRDGLTTKVSNNGAAAAATEVLLPMRPGGVIDDICRRHKLSFGPFQYDRKQSRCSPTAHTKGDDNSLRQRRAAEKKERRRAEAAMADIEAMQRRIDEENVVLTASVTAIESLSEQFRRRHSALLGRTDELPPSTPAEAEPIGHSNGSDQAALSPEATAGALRAAEAYRSLQLLYSAYGITDLIADEEAAAPDAAEAHPPSMAISPSPFRAPALVRNEATQTLPEYLLPLDVHDPPADGLHDRILWARAVHRSDAAADGGTRIDVSIIDPLISREHINRPYAPPDWCHVYENAAANPYSTFSSPGSVSAGAAVGLAGSVKASPSHVFGGAGVGGGSLRAACDGSLVCQSMVRLLSRPITGAQLHRVEPSSLRTAILTEVDPSSPNKVRLVLPMTHISANAYAMGTVIVRDRDVLLFKEGAEDKKMIRLPYRAISSIRLGATAQAADRTTPPPLNYNVPPSALQFFLMNKIQFSDTYRQFYRTVVIQPLNTGEEVAGGANAAAAAPQPSSILFDTETDCIRFLNTLDLILNPSLRGRPFASTSKADIPPPARYHLGLDSLAMAGRPAAPCLFSASDRRQLAYAKAAVVTPMDVYPTHDPLSLAEADLCASLHVPPRQLSEIKSRLLTDPTRTWLSLLDMAALCTPPSSRALDLRLARHLLDFFVSQNKLEVVEIVETVPLGAQGVNAADA